jgi:hypothetical protein
MAEVGTVYDDTPAADPTDILPGTDGGRRDAAPGPSITKKWLVASVVADAARAATNRSNPHCSASTGKAAPSVGNLVVYPVLHRSRVLHQTREQ